MFASNQSPLSLFIRQESHPQIRTKISNIGPCTRGNSLPTSPTDIVAANPALKNRSIDGFPFPVRPRQHPRMSSAWSEEIG